MTMLNMKTYARIENGNVVELFQTNGDITKMFHPSMIWIDCSTVSGIAIGWTYANNQFIAPVIQTLDIAVLKQQLSDSIDNEISLLYNKFTRFAEEYRMKNIAARAFKAAGYSGTPDPWIMSFATPTGKSPKDATDIIISLADAFDATLLTLGQLRMRKYEIVAAADASTAQSVYNDVITKANQAVAGL